jgi:hypothetical protein
VLAAGSQQAFKTQEFLPTTLDILSLYTIVRAAYYNRQALTA